MWKDLSLKALSPGPAVVLPWGGLHKCPRAQQGTNTDETLLLRNSEHNHGRAQKTSESPGSLRPSTHLPGQEVTREPGSPFSAGAASPHGPISHWMGKDMLSSSPRIPSVPHGPHLEIQEQAKLGDRESSQVQELVNKCGKQDWSRLTSGLPQWRYW